MKIGVSTHLTHRLLRPKMVHRGCFRVFESQHRLHSKRLSSLVNWMSVKMKQKTRNTRFKRKRTSNV